MITDKKIQMAKASLETMTEILEEVELSKIAKFKRNMSQVFKTLDIKSGSVLKSP